MFIKKLYDLNIKDKLNKLLPCDILMFSHDVNYGLNLKNKHYSPLMDSIREDVEKRGWKTQTILQPFSKIEGSAAWSNPILINRSYLIARLKDNVFNLFVKTKNRNIICLYKKILEKSKPIFIITIGASKELCQAAKEKKVPCIELLHGIGYSKIEWGYDKRNYMELPFGILSLDKCSTKTFQTLENVKIKQIPHPFLKRFQERKNKNIPIEWQDNNITNKYKKIILLSLQWGYDDTYSEFTGILKNHIISEDLIAAIKSSTNKNLIWAFRLHPVQLRERRYKHHLDYIKEFCENHLNTQWQWFSEMPLPVVLKKCSGHITMSSMSSYEAAYMGVKTLALCPTLQQGGHYQNMFSDLEEAGYLKKSLANTEEIIEWVKSIEPVPPFLDNLADEEAWENALEWMLGNRGKDTKEIA